MSIEQDGMTVDEAVDHLFLALDKNRDEKLSDLEFIIGAKQSPTILAILQPDGQAPEWSNLEPEHVSPSMGKCLSP